MEGIPSLPVGMSLEDLLDIECSECGGKIFDQAFVIKKLSSFLTKSGNEERYVIPVFVCRKCGKELDEESKKYVEKSRT